MVGVKMRKYFSDIWLGVSTVSIGMWITFKHLFKKNITVQYPRQALPMYEHTRAQLYNHIDDCGYCMGCSRVCPVNIFTIKGVRAGPEEDLGILPDGKPKKIHVTQFDIDMSKCLYCGLCVEECDTKSLRWEHPQQPSTFSRGEMLLKFATFTPEEVAALEAAEAERKRIKAEELAAAKKKAAEKGTDTNA